MNHAIPTVIHSLRARLVVTKTFACLNPRLITGLRTLAIRGPRRGIADIRLLSCEILLDVFLSVLRSDRDGLGLCLSLAGKNLKT